MLSQLRAGIDVVPTSGNQCERIERKAARRRCPKALAPILDNIRKYAVHASLNVPDASRE
jgi:hypothetical protein